MPQWYISLWWWTSFHTLQRICSLMFFDIDVLYLYGVHTRQATWFGRANAKMEFNTLKFDPKSSKGFQKKNYAYWQEIVFAGVILLLFWVVEYAKNKQHQIHPSWQPGNFSRPLIRLKLAPTVQNKVTINTSVCGLVNRVIYYDFQKVLAHPATSSSLF